MKTPAVTLSLMLLTMLASAADAVVITEYGPLNGTPRGITAGPDGKLWFAGDVVGSITTNGVIVEYTSTIGSHGGIAVGPDGRLWFTSVGGMLGAITPMGAVTTYGPVPEGQPAFITRGADNKMWFTSHSAHRVFNIEPNSLPPGVITSFGAVADIPYAIVAGPDGNLWFTPHGGKVIAKIDPTSGVITEYGAVAGDGHVITPGPDGNLWFTERVGSMIGTITTAGVITEYGPTLGVNQGITSGVDGNLWFAGIGTKMIGKITLGGLISEYGPVSGAPGDITSGPDGNLWFTEFDSNKIGCISGFAAEGQPCIGDSNCESQDCASGHCAPAICGNGLQQLGEACDDGNVVSGDGCDENCSLTACNNGIVTGMEQCDDGNIVSGDGCDANCSVTACGNGIVTGMEQCDDGNIVPNDGCSATCTLEPCVAAPIPGCLDAAQAQLSLSEKTSGKEKLKLQWKKVTSVTTQGAFGNPVTGTTRVAVCFYDDGGTLIRDFVIDQGGQSCAGKPCWAAKSTKGYAYKDKTAGSDGISKIGYGSGGAGKGKADAAGANNASKGQTALPPGVVAALSGNLHPTIQLVTSNGLCLGATMSEVTRDDGLQYKARKR